MPFNFKKKDKDKKDKSDKKKKIDTGPSFKLKAKHGMKD